MAKHLKQFNFDFFYKIYQKHLKQTTKIIFAQIFSQYSCAYASHISESSGKSEGANSIWKKVADGRTADYVSSGAKKQTRHIHAYS